MPTLALGVLTLSSIGWVGGSASELFIAPKALAWERKSKSERIQELEAQILEAINQLVCAKICMIVLREEWCDSAVVECNGLIVVA